MVAEIRQENSMDMDEPTASVQIVNSRKVLLNTQPEWHTRPADSPTTDQRKIARLEVENAELKAKVATLEAKVEVSVAWQKTLAGDLATAARTMLNVPGDQ
jgi:hypothetical protein